MQRHLAFLVAFAAAAAGYSSFVVPSLKTHQPIGSGSTNFYYINFAVRSSNSGQPRAAYCQTSWGDNGWTNSQAYSINVPTGLWIKCDSAQGAYDSASAFSMQLYPSFAIGNFLLGVKEDLGEGTSISGVRKIANGTNQVTCNINPTQVFPAQHAHGDCSIPVNAEALQIPLSQATA